MPEMHWRMSVPREQVLQRRLHMNGNAFRLAADVVTLFTASDAAGLGAAAMPRPADGWRAGRVSRRGRRDRTAMQLQVRRRCRPTQPAPAQQPQRGGARRRVYLHAFRPSPFRKGAPLRQYQRHTAVATAPALKAPLSSVWEAVNPIRLAYGAPVASWRRSGRLRGARPSLERSARLRAGTNAIAAARWRLLSAFKRRGSASRQRVARDTSEPPTLMQPARQGARACSHMRRQHAQAAHRASLSGGGRSISIGSSVAAACAAPMLLGGGVHVRRVPADRRLLRAGAAGKSIDGDRGGQPDGTASAIRSIVQPAVSVLTGDATLSQFLHGHRPGSPHIQASTPPPAQANPGLYRQQPTQPARSNHPPIRMRAQAASCTHMVHNSAAACMHACMRAWTSALLYAFCEALRVSLPLPSLLPVSPSQNVSSFASRPISVSCLRGGHLTQALFKNETLLQE
eukprot:365043-Chlamydomonas_euryale.AAC.3